MSGALHKIAAITRAVDGAIAAETALVIALVLIPALIAVVDLAMLYQGQAAVDEVLEETSSYVMNAGSNATDTGVHRAALNATSQAVTVSTNTACYCVSTVTTVPTMPVTVGCAGDCATGAVFQQFMTINVNSQVSVPIPVPWLNLPSPFTVRGTALVRTG